MSFNVEKKFLEKFWQFGGYVLFLYSMKNLFIKYKKHIVVTLSITILQLLFGFDPKFTLINIIWLFL
jgi:hypothetical protein